jgi:zinc protease
MAFKSLCLALTAATLALGQASPTQTTANTTNVTRATLDNGMRVVIVRDALAPVVTLEDNYLAGGQDTPTGFPGMAHAQEHMTFRGCKGLSADQIAAIYAQLGGNMNADTQQNLTQYYVTVPSQDLDVALRLDAACMAGVQDEQDQWAQERGAIEQEVSRDLSNPTYKLIVRFNHDLFAGTAYEEDALGTTESFEKTTASALKEFLTKWYAPNNAILVISGDVDPEQTLAKIKQYYGSIPRREVPAHPVINLKPIKRETFTLESNLPYTLAAIAFRFPGSSSPDFAATRVLADVLSSQRADLYGLVADGKALAAAFANMESYPAASAALAYAAVPPGTDPAGITTQVQAILKNYAEKGVPADLVDAAKKGEVASAEFGRNSISNLAALWSQALADEGRESPDEDVEAIKKVTVEDVNRVAKQYLLTEDFVIGTLKPKPSGEPVADKGFGGSEKTTATPTKPVELPDWAEAAVKSLRIPEKRLHPVDSQLPNGIRLIVQTEPTSPTVTVVGSIKTQADIETPPDKDGVSDVVDGLFSYGTKNLDRLAFQKALDDIAASATAGSSFNLKVLKQYFERGVELLADNELHPAFPQEAFQIVRQQTAEVAEGQLQSPGYRTEKALAQALLPAHDPLLRETTPKTVSGVTYEDVNAYYAKTFRPDLTTIVVIGDVTPEEARKAVEKCFGEWKASGEKPVVTLPAVPPNKASAVNVPDTSQVQDSVVLAEQLKMNRFGPDYYALQLGNHVLGGGFYATRLYRDVRQKAGYVYNIENSLQASETRAEFSVEYGCDPKNVSKARALVQDELVAMQKFNVTPAELQQAKALLLRQIPMTESSEDDVAAGFVARARIGLPLDEPFRAAKHYYELDADQVKAAFAKWVDPARLVQVVRGPAPE